MTSLARPSLLFPVFTFLAVAISGCGSTVIDGDGEDDDGQQCLAMPVCNSDEVEVDGCSDNGVPCREVSICGSTIFCELQDQCWEGPYCEFGWQVESCPNGSSCYEVTACGITILCEEEIFCDGYPSCDEGDTEVDSCPLDASCYTAEMCGSTILCMDDLMPAHECPQQIPTVGEACEPGTAPNGCNYPTGEGCFEYWQCTLGDDSYYWDIFGGGCTDGDDGEP